MSEQMHEWVKMLQLLMPHLADILLMISDFVLNYVYILYYLRWIFKESQTGIMWLI